MLNVNQFDEDLGLNIITMKYAKDRCESHVHVRGLPLVSVQNKCRTACCSVQKGNLKPSAAIAPAENAIVDWTDSE